MSRVLFPPEPVLEFLRERKVSTKAELLEACGCKAMTLWKILHGYGYLTSYNFNAKYYTLTDIPQFDEFGLWSYRQARFSRWGSLSQTIVEMVQVSPMGYVPSELTERLEVQVAQELSRLHGVGRLDRQKIGLRYVYVASDEATRKAQIVARQKEERRMLEEADLPIREVTIAVLFEMVKDDDVAPRALARRLKRRKVPVTEGDVHKIITRYNLTEKRGL